MGKRGSGGVSPFLCGEPPPFARATARRCRTPVRRCRSSRRRGASSA
jgi:hypothetical protein